MNQITNQEFNEAKDNIENIKIIKTVTKKYIKYIPKDDLQNCGLIGLWGCLKRFDKSKGRSFKSFLYIMVAWECMRWIIKDKKFRDKHKKLHFTDKPLTIVSKDEYNEFADILSILPKKLASIIEYKVIYKMTLSEIGKKHKMSRETVRREITKALAKIKNVYRTMPN